MVTPELVLGVVGFGVTLATMFYKFGRLEGKITARLDEHERRLNEADRRHSVATI